MTTTMKLLDSYSFSAGTNSFIDSCYESTIGRLLQQCFCDSVPIIITCVILIWLILLVVLKNSLTF